MNILSGYKGYIQSLGSEFVKFLEVYNKCIDIAKKYEIIGQVEFKARVKDFSSAMNNTENKMLDDMFGFEIITPSEREKEIFKLFNLLIFKNVRRREFTNGKTGYQAYHSTEQNLNIFKDKNLEDIIKEFVKNGTIDDVTKINKNEEIKKERKMFEILNAEEMEEELIKSDRKRGIVAALKEMVETVQSANIDVNKLPFIEFHMLNSAMYEEAIRGKCSHDKYKSADNGKSVENDEIIKMYEERKLYRGINSPWKFERVENGKIELQDFNKTLIEKWPFLRDNIVQTRLEGKEEERKEDIRKIDIFLASQYEFLSDYIGEDKAELENLDDIKKAEMWGMIKTFMTFGMIEPAKVSALFNNIPSNEEK